MLLSLQYYGEESLRYLVSCTIHNSETDAGQTKPSLGAEDIWHHEASSFSTPKFTRLPRAVTMEQMEVRSSNQSAARQSFRNHPPEPLSSCQVFAKGSLLSANQRARLSEARHQPWRFLEPIEAGTRLGDDGSPSKDVDNEGHVDTVQSLQIYFEQRSAEAERQRDGASQAKNNAAAAAEQLLTANTGFRDASLLWARGELEELEDALPQRLPAPARPRGEEEKRSAGPVRTRAGHENGTSHGRGEQMDERSASIIDKRELSSSTHRATGAGSWENAHAPPRVPPPHSRADSGSTGRAIQTGDRSPLQHNARPPVAPAAQIGADEEEQGRSTSNRSRPTLVCAVGDGQPGDQQDVDLLTPRLPIVLFYHIPQSMNKVFPLMVWSLIVPQALSLGTGLAPNFPTPPPGNLTAPVRLDQLQENRASEGLQRATRDNY
ncbi:hypothetical protein DNTS_015409 [Danionella cerebrum]|uniref:Uncharacterized protein n=1 Tax=Danionella cerebrum TaxID=2873325 RepID=A0A553R3S5_9TELE|nr:hypothetical protein DNTS_015409 [Danionella translucida]